MVEFSAFQFRIATKRLPVKGTHTEYREGILLRSTTNPNIWSEASPLPGFSTDTLDDVKASLDSNNIDVPSLEFAVESLSSDFPISGKIPVCALLASTDLDSFTYSANQLSDSPFRAVKVKVGRSSIEDDIRRVGALRNALRADQSIRLDSNRSWNLPEAIHFANQIAEFQIDFIEEPVENPNDLEQFFAESGCRYALDETLVDQRFDVQDFPNASVFVVKPTIIGRFSRIKSLIALEKPIVFSSVFESGVGIYQIGRMAAACSENIAVGLDTYRWLKEDVVLTPWSFDDGYFEFHEPPKVDLNCLTPIQSA